MNASLVSRLLNTADASQFFETSVRIWRNIGIVEKRMNIKLKSITGIREPRNLSREIGFPNVIPGIIVWPAKRAVGLVIKRCVSRRQVRNAIQALQMLACSPQSNPNLPTPASRGSGVLARSSSHPPDAICWNPPARLIEVSTQTDWPVDLFEAWVRANPHRVLKILDLDPDLLLGLPPPSPTPSPSSPPPPPYEPLSSLVGSPHHSPSRSLTTGNY